MSENSEKIAKIYQQKSNSENVGETFPQICYIFKLLNVSYLSVLMAFMKLDYTRCTLKVGGLHSRGAVLPFWSFTD